MSPRKITGICGVDICGVYSVVAVQSVGNIRLRAKNTMRNIGYKKTLMRLHKKLDFIYRKMVHRQLDKLPKTHYDRWPHTTSQCASHTYL